MRLHAATIVPVFLCLVPLASAKQSLFAIQVSEGDEVDEYEATFSFMSSVSGHGKFKRTTDSSRTMFDSEISVRIREDEVNADALVELVPAGSGYVVRTEARLQSTAGVTATYLLEAHRMHECPRLVLRHNLTTVPDHLLTFSSGLTETCDGEDKSRITIGVDLSSSLSPLLTTHLQQLFVLTGDSGWESMNATNPAMDVTVKAEWGGSGSLYHYRKTVKLESKIPDWLAPGYSLQYENAADAIILSILRNDLHVTSRDEL